MGDVIRDILPRDRRYAILHARAASVIIEGDAGGGPRSVEAQLVDLSRSGAELSVATCPSIDAAARLLINVPELQIDLVVEIEVCWAEPGEDDTWRLGCRFEPELPENLLEQLATGGVLDRRTDSRTPVSLRATACWEHDEARVPVRLQDISAGGFCMACAHISQSDRRLLLHLSRPDGKMESIKARMQWRLKTGDQYLVGCGLENVLDFHRLRAVADAEAEQRKLEASKRAPRTPWIMFGCVASITFIVSFALLSLATRESSPPNDRLVADARGAGGVVKTSDRSAAKESAATAPTAAPAAATSAPPPSDPPTATLGPNDGAVVASPNASDVDGPTSDPNSPPAADVVITQETEIEVRVAAQPAPPASPQDTVPAAGPTEIVASPPSNGDQPPADAIEAPPADTAPADASSPPPPPADDGQQAPMGEGRQPPAGDDRRAVEPPPVATPYGLREALRRLGEARDAARRASDAPPAGGTALPPIEPPSPPTPDRPRTPAPAVPAPPPGAPTAPLPTDPATPAVVEPAAPPAGESAVPSAAEPSSQPTKEATAPPTDEPKTKPPAPGAAPQPAPSAESPVANPPATAHRTAPRSMTPEDNVEAVAAFNRGHNLYRRRQYAQAAAAFQEAASASSENPFYRYTLALAQYQLGQRDEAVRTARQAIALEKDHPIAQWGLRMQSYQGGARLWLEHLRGGK